MAPPAARAAGLIKRPQAPPQPPSRNPEGRPQSSPTAQARKDSSSVFRSIWNAFSSDSDSAATWAVICVTFVFCLLAAGRQWDNRLKAEALAKDVPYTAGERGVVYMKAETAHFDDVFTGSVRFGVTEWDNSTSRVIAALSPDILSNLNSCDLARRIGKPCGTAHISFAATVMAGSLLYYGPSATFTNTGACWAAHHKGYRVVAGNVTIVGEGGALRIIGDGFRDKYHNGDDRFTVSDTFCATMTKIPYATNFWEDAKGDVLGCSSGKRKGMGFIPIQCRFGAGDSVSAEQVTSLSIINACFDVNDVLLQYKGTDSATRCYTSDVLNACGGIPPAKASTTYVVRVSESQIEYNAVRVSPNITLIQWLPDVRLNSKYLLVSDCVVLESVCGRGEVGCGFPTLADYLKGGGTSCSNAFFIQKEFFYVEGGTADATRFVANWTLDGRVSAASVVTLQGRPSATACSSFRDVESLGMFVLLNPHLGINQQRDIGTLAMVYNVAEGILYGTNKTVSRDVCAKVASRVPGNVIDVSHDMAGMRFATLDPSAPDPEEVACASLSLKQPSATIYNLELCRVRSDYSVECDFQGGCNPLTPTEAINLADCTCCTHVTRIVSGLNATKEIRGEITDCQMCSSTSNIEMITTPQGVRTCACSETFVNTTTRYIYEPYVSGETTFMFHGECKKRTISVLDLPTVLSSNSSILHETLYDCYKHHRSCASGYTLRSADVRGGQVISSARAERVGCFIDEPDSWGDIDHCSGGFGSCRADFAKEGLSWYAHCHGSCLSTSHCYCYALIPNGGIVDGDRTENSGRFESWYSSWGAFDRWWTKPAQQRFAGNHFVPHYACCPTSGSTPAWRPTTDFLKKDQSCEWPVHSGNGNQWRVYCYDSSLGEIVTSGFTAVDPPPITAA